MTLTSKRFTGLDTNGWEARESESGADLCKKDIPADVRRYGGFHAGHMCRSLMDDRRELGAYHRRKASEERQELQMLVSDVSHQVKTPVSNLKMVTDTLLSKSVTEEEQREFLQGIRNQTDKLEFLFQALVKTSRLETGAIRLEKKNAPLIDTLAMACI